MKLRESKIAINCTGTLLPFKSSVVLLRNIRTYALLLDINAQRYQNMIVFLFDF